MRCIYQGDISTGQDALALDRYGAIDAIIPIRPSSPKGPRLHATALIAALPDHCADMAAASHFDMGGEHMHGCTIAAASARIIVDDAARDMDRRAFARAAAWRTTPGPSSTQPSPRSGPPQQPRRSAVRRRASRHGAPESAQQCGKRLPAAPIRFPVLRRHLPAARPPQPISRDRAVTDEGNDP